MITYQQIIIMMTLRSDASKEWSHAQGKTYLTKGKRAENQLTQTNKLIDYPHITRCFDHKGGLIIKQMT